MDELQVFEPEAVKIAPRHPCHFGCGRSFKREEHLRRHERSHTDANSHVCNICGRGFTRNDILQRHIVRHDAPGHAHRRSDRACDACHLSKVRCDGNKPCSRCIKKLFVCKFERGRGNVDQYLVSQSPEREGVGTDIEEQSMDIIQEDPSTQLESRVLQQRSPSIQSFPHIKVQSKSKEEHTISQAITARDTEIYFKYFHDRWPILHFDTFGETDPYVLRASVAMIGAWLEGRNESQDRALILHDRLMAHILERLQRFSYFDERNKEWPIAHYQAALLNIIFGIYCGIHNVVLQVILMRNVLVSVLREEGFFEREQTAGQEKPNAFPAYLYMKRQERKRLAICLFRVDSYLSLIRGHPPVLNGEELYFGLPSTYSVWNAGNLLAWKTRMIDEPSDREDIPASNILRLDFSNMSARPLQLSLLLAEDIQLAFCAATSHIWQFRERSRNSKTLNYSTQESLQEHLEAWRRSLETLTIQVSPNVDQANTKTHGLVPLNYYMGTEGTSVEKWQCIAMERFNSIKFDTFMLYRVLSLYLLSDIRTLQLLAREFMSPGEVPLDINYLQETSQWILRTSSMRALWHAVEVMKALRTASKYSEGTLDPICHIAWAMARLIIWACAIYSSQPCDQCALHLESYSCGVFELMTATDADCEGWIGSRSRVSIDGIVLCRCNVDRLMDWICTSVTLKREWQVADTIAPFPQGALTH